jgi:tetratricopeptide (TPR) repeat protein
MRGHFHEGLKWLTGAIQHNDTKRSSARASALLGVSLLRNGLGEMRDALFPAQESVEIFRELGDEKGLAEGLMIEGLTQLWQGDADTGRSHTREALSLYQKVGDRWGEAQALYRLGSYLADYGGDLSGRDMLEESATILEELQEKYLYANVLISLGIIDMSLGNYAIAQSSFEPGLAVANEIRHPWGIADSLTNLGCLFRIQGEYQKAQSYLEEAMGVYREQGRNIWETDVLCALAENAMAQCNFATAHIHLQAANSLLGSSKNTWLQVLVLYFQGLLAYYEGDDNKAVDLLENTIQLSRDGQFKPDLARSLISLGRVRLRLGEVGRARKIILDGLAFYQELGQKLGIVHSLEALAYVSTAQGEYTQAVVVMATADRLRQSVGAHLPTFERAAHDAWVSQSRLVLGEALFIETWNNAVDTPYEESLGKILKSYRAQG